MQTFQRAEIRKNESMILEKIVEMGGEVIELSAEERARWVEVSQKAVFEAFPKEMSPEIVQAVRDAIKE